MHVDGQVGDDERARAGLPRIRVEPFPAVRLEERRVRHRDERHRHTLVDVAQALQTLRRTHALGERPLRRATDDRAVGERVREREPDLDQVGATGLGAAASSAVACPAMR